MATTRKIALEGWVITESFQHRGITHSQGEVPPPMTIEEADALRVAGKLLRPGEQRGTATVEHILAGSDSDVLRRIRREHPAPDVLKVALTAARSAPRSVVLIEALALLVREPVTDRE